MRLPGFVNGSNQSPSRSINSEATINLIVESGSGTPKRKPCLLDRPSLTPFTWISPGPSRALFHQDGRLFAVSGAYFYEIFQSRNVLVRGEMETDSRVATISSNGTNAGQQLFIVSGGLGYTFNLSTNAFAEITDTDLETPLWGGAFLDSYFIALNVNTNTFQLSQLLEGNEWNGLDAGQTNQSSDNKIGMVVSNQKLWLFGTKSTEVWFNSGAASFPFQPLAGVLIEHGTAAPYSTVAVDNTVFWVGADAQGAGLVWKAEGYTPVPVHNYAVAYYLQNLPRLDDLIGFSFQADAHAYYCLYSPHTPSGSNDAFTWVYDIRENQWLQWGHWHPELMCWRPWVPRCQAFGWGMQFFGDRQSGAIYVGKKQKRVEDFIVARNL